MSKMLHARMVIQCTCFNKISADNILKHIVCFLFFTENRFDISCKLSPKETICMKCLSLSGKNKKNMISLLSDEYAYRVVKVKCCLDKYLNSAEKDLRNKRNKYVNIMYHIIRGLSARLA